MFHTTCFVPIVVLAGMTFASACQAQTVSTSSAAPVDESSKRETRTISLHFVRPTAFITLLLPAQPRSETTGVRYAGMTREQAARFALLQSIETVNVDDIGGQLTIRGTHQSCEQFEVLARFLDVAPKQTRLRVRILRGGQIGSKPADADVVATAWVEGASNAPQQTTLLGDGLLFAVTLVPRLHGDGSLNVATWLAVASGAARSSVSPQPGTHTQSSVIGATLELSNKPREVAVSYNPGQAGPLQTFRLEVTPLVAERLHTLPPIAANPNTK